MTNWDLKIIILNILKNKKYSIIDYLDFWYTTENLKDSYTKQIIEEMEDIHNLQSWEKASKRKITGFLKDALRIVY